MGMFSWCTSDTRKSISAMGDVPWTAQEVYVLNPFGEPYKENDYYGYGIFGGHDVFALVAKWNVPEKCKDENGEWLPGEEIRNIGIKLACYDWDHVKLDYPIKIVEDPSIPYDKAGISPSCPYQGAYYDDGLTKAEMAKKIDTVFSDLEACEKNYEVLKGLYDKGAHAYWEVINELDVMDRHDKDFLRMIVTDEKTPQNVLLGIAKDCNIYVAQELVRNSELDMDTLKILKERFPKEIYMQNMVRKHRNYVPEFSAAQVNDRVMAQVEQFINDYEMNLDVHVWDDAEAREMGESWLHGITHNGYLDLKKEIDQLPEYDEGGCVEVWYENFEGKKEFLYHEDDDGAYFNVWALVKDFGLDESQLENAEGCQDLESQIAKADLMRSSDKDHKRKTKDDLEI